ncbi:MAG TPA: malto-oligosyltrehalose synthase, partial [Acidimicrobiales bacterium]|nr:malto-oligosyltrehalose synthase [Acidimicrobiales bacterium]
AVEKILARHERLPESWPVAGTSGYDFLIRVNNLVVASEHEQAMTDSYHLFTGETEPWEEVVHAAKLQVMRQDLAAEVERQTTLLAHICDRHRRNRDHTRRELRDALREMVAGFGVYRTYVRPGRPATEQDRRELDHAVEATRRRRPDIDSELCLFLGELALGVHEGESEAEFCERLQQVTAPVMAKGVEDTAFYRYNRLVSLNEVGGEPGIFGTPVSQFHETTSRTARRWPETMLTLSTHDTKRSADVRARLNVLSEIPNEWREAVARWAELAARHWRDAEPDRNAEYLLYQTLVGAWPLDLNRALLFMSKAVREAKVRTSWVEPDVGYEEALEGFLRGLFGDDSFLRGVESFLADNHVVGRGRQNSLVQSALLLTCPGVPDLYQGTELWDLSLVDPDNRRPVDFDIRFHLLHEVKSASVTDVTGRLDAGSPKLWMVHRLLEHRRHNPEQFETSTYEPLASQGPSSSSMVAFTRSDLSVVAPVRTDALLAGTTVALPGGQWRDVLSGEAYSGGTHDVARLTSAFPVAVLSRGTG